MQRPDVWTQIEQGTNWPWLLTLAILVLLYILLVKWGEFSLERIVKIFLTELRQASAGHVTRGAINLVGVISCTTLLVFYSVSGEFRAFVELAAGTTNSQITAVSVAPQMGVLIVASLTVVSLLSVGGRK